MDSTTLDQARMAVADYLGITKDAVIAGSDLFALGVTTIEIRDGLASHLAQVFSITFTLDEMYGLAYLAQVYDVIAAKLPQA